jgi:hypothetical protein
MAEVIKKARTTTSGPTIIYVAFDIEKLGNRVKDAINAIGACVGFQNGTKIETKCWCLKPPDGYVPEKRCMREFWHNPKKPELRVLLAMIEAASVDAGLGMAMFIKWYDDLENRFPSPDYSIELVSDNPGFDIGHLDYYVQLYTKRKSLRFSTYFYDKAGNKVDKGYVDELGDPAERHYRRLRDPSSRLYKTEFKKKVWDAANARCLHDHWPENDATCIYYAQVFCDYEIQEEERAKVRAESVTNIGIDITNAVEKLRGMPVIDHEPTLLLLSRIGHSGSMMKKILEEKKLNAPEIYGVYV